MKSLYKDNLVEVTDEEIIFRRYYFPFGNDKHLQLSQIQNIEVRPPSISFGSWRLWGGGPRIWFPCDMARPQRDMIFVAWLRGRWMRIGFTAENSRELVAVFKRLRLVSLDGLKIKSSSPA